MALNLGRLFAGWLGRLLGRAPSSTHHVRKQVRDAFAAKITGLSTTGSRVFTSRIDNLAASDLPCIRLYTVVEEIQHDDVLAVPYMQHRTVGLRVEVLAKQASGMVDTLNQICLEVEEAIEAEPTLGGLSPLHASYRHVDEQYSGGLSSGNAGDQPAGMATMDWQFVVLTMNDAPNVAL